MKKYGVEGKTEAKSRNKGITLMALVVTVIVLLILATITVSTFSGNSLVNRTFTAKEEADINSEMKLIGTASNQAKNQDKYGDLTEETFINAVELNVGKGETEVEYYKDQKVFTVEFKKSKRVYYVSAVGNVKYIGKLGDVIMIFADPQGSISLKEEYSINISIQSLTEKNDLNKIKYGWTREQNGEPETYIDKTM